MSTISQVTTAVTGNTITAAVWNNEFSNILNDYNGGITNANIDASAAIAYSKLALTGSILNADLAGSIAASKISNTAATLSDTQTLTNKTLTSPTINTPTTTGEVLNTSRQPITAATASGSYDFDLSAAQHFLITLSSNSTLTVSNTLGNGQAFIIHLKQGGAGSKLVTWFGSLSWAGGSTPTLTTATGKIDSFGFIYSSAESKYFGYIIGQNI